MVSCSDSGLSVRRPPAASPSPGRPTSPGRRGQGRPGKRNVQSRALPWMRSSISARSAYCGRARSLPLWRTAAAAPGHLHASAGDCQLRGDGYPGARSGRRQLAAARRARPGAGEPASWRDSSTVITTASSSAVGRPLTTRITRLHRPLELVRVVSLRSCSWQALSIDHAFGVPNQRCSAAWRGVVPSSTHAT